MPNTYLESVVREFDGHECMTDKVFRRSGCWKASGEFFMRPFDRLPRIPKSLETWNSIFLYYRALQVGIELKTNLRVRSDKYRGLKLRMFWVCRKAKKVFIPKVYQTNSSKNIVEIVKNHWQKILKNLEKIVKIEKKDKNSS